MAVRSVDVSYLGGERLIRHAKRFRNAESDLGGVRLIDKRTRHAEVAK